MCSGTALVGLIVIRYLNTLVDQGNSHTRDENACFMAFVLVPSADCTFI